MTAHQYLAPLDVLQDGLGFDEADLRANRAGQMTGRQRETLWQRKINILGISVYGVYIVGLLCACGLISGLQTSVLLLLCLVLAGAFSAWLVLWRKVQADVSSGAVAAVSGVVRTDVEPGHATRYKVHIACHTFRVSKAALLSFNQGETYTLYYAPHSKVILAAERLE